MAPLEPWEKVIIDADEFLATIHGQMACTDCHAGDSENLDKDSAHVEIVAKPSEKGEACAQCHSKQVETFADSLHVSQAGYWDSMTARGVPEDHPAVEEMFGNHCESCHTSCGDCHVSQPTSVGGGLIDNHIFKARPSLTRNCTACHGSRVGNEYMGKNEGVLADVHFRQGRMSCVDCHTGSEMHGETTQSCEECHDTSDEAFVATDRYSGPILPQCTDCHAGITDGEDGNMMHTMHGDKVSCQVCHSMSYSSCDGCHVEVSEETGKPKFSTEGLYMTFMIGKNPLQNYHRPFEYVPVRHIPVSPDSYAYYGEDLMPDFNAVPTWLYTTPHNIQLNTPQTESCENCHGNTEIFLTADKVAPSELEANASVIIEEPIFTQIGGD
ncbi:MAG: hypothetical protein JEZ06_14075 [Anaerolineaceae bacterium]|nr:hypothetical protein [Anaerolineaceae bacterium]